MYFRGVQTDCWYNSSSIFTACRDRLTGLFNRRAGLSELERLIHAGKPFALMFVDIEGCKAINDAHGHAIGDEALIWVAPKLNEQTRDADTVLRYGGDEFVIATSGLSDALQQPLEAALKTGLRGGAIPRRRADARGVAGGCGSGDVRAQTPSKLSAARGEKTQPAREW